MEIDNNRFDDEIRNRLFRLNNSFPEDFSDADILWNRMKQKKKEKRQVRLRVALAVAASILIVVVAIVNTWKADKNAIDKIVQANDPTEAISENEALQYISEWCRINNVTCASPDFIELKAELQESASSLAEINRQIAVFGNDENLLRARSRIENHQAHLIKAMVQTL